MKKKQIYEVMGNIHIGMPVEVYVKELEAYSLKQAKFKTFLKIREEHPNLKKLNKIDSKKLYNQISKLHYIKLN